MFHISFVKKLHKSVNLLSKQIVITHAFLCIIETVKVQFMSKHEPVVTIETVNRYCSWSYNYFQESITLDFSIHDCENVSMFHV